jgi:predicted O-methyltransferase YrrM
MAFFKTAMKKSDFIKMGVSKPSWAWAILKSSFYSKFSKAKYTKRTQEYEKFTVQFEQVLSNASNASSDEIKSIIQESSRLIIDRGKRTDLIPIKYDASPELAILSYCIVRLRKPNIVVETGVARGITSFFLLSALERNGKGRLYSIDLPMMGKEEVGILVPDNLKARWELVFGVGFREMKRLRKRFNEIEMFIHDSDHSYYGQKAEYGVALKWLTNDGILISDDVGNDAFLEESESSGRHPMILAQEKSENIGILMGNPKLDPKES